jgi:hypothetical protein
VRFSSRHESKYLIHKRDSSLCLDFLKVLFRLISFGFCSMKFNASIVMMILKHILEYLTICVLVKFYWVDCYLRSNPEVLKEASGNDRELDTRDSSYYLNLDDFYREEDDDLYNNQYKGEVYWHQNSHHSSSDEDHYYPEDWHQDEDVEEHHRYISKDEDDDFSYYHRHRSQADDFNNQLDADSLHSYFHDDGSHGDDWTESARNRLKSGGDSDDDENLVSS